MGLFDKVKTILFDEVPEEVEVSVDEKNLPDRKKERLKNKAKQEKSGFIDYQEQKEEDTIKEVIIPAEEEEKKEEFPSRTSIYSSMFEEDPIIEEEPGSINAEIKEEVKEIVTPVVEPSIKESKVKVEEKNYRELITKPVDDSKKPFRVTPIISPVYGVIDDSSVGDTLPEREVIREKTVVDKKRNFGPVSFNDEPLPEPIKYEAPIDDEISAVDDSIADLINETIEEETKPKKTSRTKKQEEIETAIEDAFEPTSEFDRIIEEDTFVPDPDEELIGFPEEDEIIGGTEEDKKVFEMEEPVVDIEGSEEVVNETNNDVPDDTIETDLFNLIDSMYKSDDSEVE